MIKVWDYLKEYQFLRNDILKIVDEVFKGGILIFGPKLEILLLQIIITIIFLIATKLVWNRGLRLYESASS